MSWLGAATPAYVACPSTQSKQQMEKSAVGERKLIQATIPCLQSLRLLALAFRSLSVAQAILPRLIAIQALRRATGDSVHVPMERDRLAFKMSLQRNRSLLTDAIWEDGEMKAKIRFGLMALVVATGMALGFGGTATAATIASAKPTATPITYVKPAWKETQYCNEQLKYYNIEMTYASGAWADGDYELLQMHSDNADDFIDNWYRAGCDRV
jgi:hypothetical protein